MNTATQLEKPYRLSIEQYEAMVDAGVFTSEDRMELIEGLLVAKTTKNLEQDRKLAETYGAGGIPVYWIINIPDRQLEVFSAPVNGAYSVHQILLETESVDLVIEGRILGRIGVAELLPRP